MSITKSVPVIRFKEFSEEWDDKEFSDFYRVISGYAFKAIDYEKEGLAIINGESIQNGRIAANNLNFLPSSFRGQYSDFLLECGDIVLGLNRPVTNGLLKIARIPESLSGALLYQRAGKIGFNSIIDPNFSFVILEKEVLAHTLREAVGSDQPFISTSKLSKWRMLFPKLNEERTVIGNYFKKLDSLINQHQQKHDKLSNIKKSMLEKMFPKQGETVPEIRFKGFSGDWKTSEISELALFNPKEELPEQFKYVDLESVKGTSLIAYRIESRKTAPSRAQRLAKRGDVFYQTVRPYQKNNYLFNKVENDYVFSTGYAQLRPYSDENFLLTLVQRDSFVKNVLDNCTGTSYPAINSTVLASLEVNYPATEEEKKQIGNYFQKLDVLINQHQQQITKLNNIKQACLTKMFV